MSGIKTFTLGQDKTWRGKTFVTGLFWQPLAAPTAGNARASRGKVRQEMSTIARQIKADLAVLRHGDLYQTGMASLADGARAGQISAAAVISKAMTMQGVRDFLVAAQVPDGRWVYVAQMDGVILPDGDFLGAEDEVRALMQSHSDGTATPLTYYAPVHWGFPATEDREFRTFLPTRKGKPVFYRWWCLSPIRLNVTTLARRLAPGIGIVAVATAAGLGWVSYQDRAGAEEALARQRQAAEQARAQAALVTPWRQSAPAEVWLMTCLDALDATPVSPGGWMLKTAECTVDGGLRVTWSARPDGRRAGLYKRVPDAVVSDDGTYASRQTAITWPGGREEALRVHNDATAHLADRLADIGVAPAIRNKPQAGGASWRTVAWSATSTFGPQTLLSAIDQPGLRITRVAYTLNTSEWTLEGDLYVK